MTARMTPIAALVPVVHAGLTHEPITEVHDRHVVFLRRHASVARSQHARSIADEMDAIAERLECAIRSRQIQHVAEAHR